MTNQTAGDRAAVTLADRLVVVGTWLIAVSLVILAVFVGWHSQLTPEEVALPEPAKALVIAEPAAQITNLGVPAYSASVPVKAISRLARLHTIVPSRPRQDIVKYTVETGDSVFGIAKKYNVEPETVLWANYDLLNDSPETLSPGMELNIPPIDGVYYQWKEGDSLEGIAAQYKTTVEEIVNWAGNKLDLADPKIEPDTWLMLPNGEREFRSWIVPQIARGAAGVSKSVYGPGACEGSYEGVYGTGGFIWPSASHVLSGNDFWSGHLGIDIAAGLGDPISASDSGVVVFAGWSTGGYGYMVMIDHGNGYQTVYAHLSSVGVSCGQSVYQGGYIGGSGSTGNSTGTHLHFEVRLAGAFVNPWHVLP
ncbi:MAG: M23 family metallopeptidase [Anaerolineales bacterium]|jgi:murein DD-endopeptidase MepM/ murein hydrolase activator NlpD|nr:M23 family metallopeptidase [Anaerolineales bacterium]